jgi:hypothetical protein
MSAPAAARRLSHVCPPPCGNVTTAEIRPDPEHVNGEAVTFSHLAGLDYGNHSLPLSMPCPRCGRGLGASWSVWRAEA